VNVDIGLATRKLSRVEGVSYHEGMAPRTWLQRWRTTSVTVEDLQRAKSARRRLWAVGAIAFALLYIYNYPIGVFPRSGDLLLATRTFFVLATLAIGFSLARDTGRVLRPRMRAQLDPGTAGATDFIVRLAFFIGTAWTALAVTDINPQTLVGAAAITAIVVGLAAQQILGNLFAGLILFSARPYRIGDRIRLQAGALAGQFEGRAVAFGLMYTVFEDDGDQTLIPNSALLACAVTPLRSPARVDFTAHLRPGVLPSQVQDLLARSVTVQLIDPPEISLEALEEQIVVRIIATPLHDEDGPQLADQVLRAVRRVTLVEDDFATREFEALVERVEADREEDDRPTLHGLS
jgi:small conductance mechanosensitive channel